MDARLCSGCKSLNLGSVFWTGEVGWPMVSLDTSKHEGLRSINHLSDSAKDCECCRHMYSMLKESINKRMTMKGLRNPPNLEIFQDIPIFFKACRVSQSLTVDYGIEVFRSDGSKDGFLSVSEGSSLRSGGC